MLCSVIVFCELVFSCRCARLRHTYEIAPVSMVFETELMKRLCGMIGYETGEGIMAPGRPLFNDIVSLG